MLSMCVCVSVIECQKQQDSVATRCSVIALILF